MEDMGKSLNGIMNQHKNKMVEAINKLRGEMEEISELVSKIKGIIEELDVVKDAVEATSTEYYDLILEEIAKRTDSEIATVEDTLDNLYEINKYAWYKVLFKELAKLFDECYDGHITDIKKAI